MRKFQRLKSSFSKVKKIKHIRWLLPGWVFYEYYKVHKLKGNNKLKSFGHGAKAEVIRLAAFASLPVPGTYELTTAGLALLKKKIEDNNIEKLTLKSFKDFIPVKNIKINKENLIGDLHFKIIPKEKKIYFKIFYRKK